MRYIICINWLYIVFNIVIIIIIDIIININIIVIGIIIYTFTKKLIPFMKPNNDCIQITYYVTPDRVNDYLLTLWVLSAVKVAFLDLIIFLFVTYILLNCFFNLFFTLLKHFERSCPKCNVMINAYVYDISDWIHATWIII